MSMTEREREQRGISRRKLFIMGNFAVVGALGALLAVPIGGYIAGAIGLFQPVVRVRLGLLSQFPIDVPTYARFTVPVSGSGITAQRPIGVYVVRSGTDPNGLGLSVFYNGCTHMGCPVRWDPYETLFRCPCHGGEYDMQGRVVHGPPPYALRRLKTQVIGNALYVYNTVYD